MRKILLHICCGICAGWAIEKLKTDGFSVAGFFYNPNIQPEEEYFKRLSAAQSVAQLHAIDLLTGDYQPEKWLEQVKGWENEPENGKRCQLCFRLRLEESWRLAQKNEIPQITTTLTISPHKDFELIKRIGTSVAGKNFLAYNFKKEEGFKKSNTFAREHSLYRQNYCGCLFSRDSD